jgi:hypothetical protein
MPIRIQMQYTAAEYLTARWDGSRPGRVGGGDGMPGRRSTVALFHHELRDDAEIDARRHPRRQVAAAGSAAVKAAQPKEAIEVPRRRQESRSAAVPARATVADLLEQIVLIAVEDARLREGSSKPCLRTD